MQFAAFALPLSRMYKWLSNCTRAKSSVFLINYHTIYSVDVSGQLHAQAVLPSNKDHSVRNRRRGQLQSRSGAPAIEPRFLGSSSCRSFTVLFEQFLLRVYEQHFILRILKLPHCYHCKNSPYINKHVVVKLEIRGSVHHITILTVKNPTRCNSVSKFYYSLF